MIGSGPYPAFAYPHIIVTLDFVLLHHLKLVAQCESLRLQECSLARMRGALQRSLRHSLALNGARRAYHATVLPSLLSTTSPEFRAKAEAMDAVVSEFESKVAAARLGGGMKAAERMRNKGKKLPRERCVSVFSASCKGQDNETGS